MKSENKRKISPNAVVSTLLSFLMCLLLFFVAISVSMKLTIYNEGFFKQTLEKSNYFDNVSSSISEKFVSHANASGIDAEFLVNTIDREALKNDIEKANSVLYGGEGFSESNKQEFSASLTTALKEYAVDNNFELNAEIEGNLQFLANKCAETYADSISFPFINQLAAQVSNTSLIITWFMVVCAALFVIILFFVFIINRKRIHRAFSYLFYSIAAAFLMLVVPSGIGLATDFISNIAIYEKPLYMFVTTYLRSYLIILLIICAFLFVLLVGSIICYAVALKRSKKMAKEKRQKISDTAETKNGIRPLTLGNAKLKRLSEK